jgi:predicted DCC family thiol-disulfide oxidoreductase YuxK
MTESRTTMNSPVVGADSLNRLGPMESVWSRFWFAPADAATLGFCRFVVLCGAFLYYGGRNFESWGYVRDSFWQSTWLFMHLHWRPLSPGPMETLGIVWKAALLLGGIGLFTRVSCGVAFGLGLYLLGLSNNIGKVDHNDGIVLWSFLVMAIARSGDGWSIDSLLRAARGKIAPSLHAEYRWPPRMMQVLMAVVFCIAGIAKLRASGLAWAFSDNLRNTFIMQYYLSDPPLRGLLLWIASQRWLCEFLAISTLVCETGAPLALVSRWARWILIPSLFLMQLGNELVLGINFRQFMLCYVFWVPWSDVGREIRGRASQQKKVAVLYDGSCGLCQRTMAVIRRIDLLNKVEILDAMNKWPSIANRFSSLNQDECLRVMHAIHTSGRVTTGFDAYRTIARAVPLGWLLLPLMYVPGVPAVGRAAYQRIANRRHRSGCAVGGARGASSTVD